MSSLNNKIHIVKAVPEDALGITKVLHTTWLATYPNEEFGITKEAIEESYKDSFSSENIQKLQEKIKNSPENELRVVVKIDNVIVGIGTMLKNEDTNFLRTLYILPEYQRQGIGKLIWDTLFEFADRSKDTLLEVATYNKNAISFYEKLGFKDSGKRSEWNNFRVVKQGLVIPEMGMIRKVGA